MNDEETSWLEKEIQDLLDESNVGLYEFVWLLRGRRPTISFDSARQIAEEALRRLLSAGAGRLVFLTWPGQEAGADLPPQALQSSDWDDPRKGQRYVGLTPA
jgi:hypothetical protein